MRWERRGLFYLTARARLRQLPVRPAAAKHGSPFRCYHHIEMRPEALGRVLGIGLRVAGRVAGQRIGVATQSSPVPATYTPSAPMQAAPASPNSRASGHATGSIGSAVSRGLSGFFKPFRRVGGILWLEITGVFFFLPVLVFAPTLWRTRMSWAHGPDHRTFVASAVVVVIFFYLGVTSFWRARRK